MQKRYNVPAVGVAQKKIKKMLSSELQAAGTGQSECGRGKWCGGGGYQARG